MLRVSQGFGKALWLKHCNTPKTLLAWLGGVCVYVCFCFTVQASSPPSSSQSFALLTPSSIFISQDSAFHFLTYSIGYYVFLICLKTKAVSNPFTGGQSTTADNLIPLIMRTHAENCTEWNIQCNIHPGNANARVTTFSILHRAICVPTLSWPAGPVGRVSISPFSSIYQEVGSRWQGS